MQFWIAAALLVALSLVLVLLPLLRGSGQGGRRASYDLQIYRDQLREVDAELARGVLTAEEAEATRIEISRRLIAAGDAEERETDIATAPRRMSRLAGLLLTLAVGGSAFAIYDRLGAAGMPDLPLAERERRLAEARANRPEQAEAEAAVERRFSENPDLRPALRDQDAALIAQLREKLEDRPGDLVGRRLLARTLGALGQYREARAAQQEVVDMQGGAAAPGDLVDLAELMVVAAGGYVSPEAEAAIVRALERSPDDPVARYYSGLSLIQSGRADLAYPIWARLLGEGPADAPWIAPIERDIGEVARLAGQPIPEAASPAPGPGRAEIDAAEALSPEERQEMIEGMVARLGERLATQGGPPGDWARLIRSLGVIGQPDRARAILDEARTAFEGDPRAIAEIEDAAREGGILR